MQDIIKKEIVIEASKEQIYDAIAKADQVIHWFPNDIEGEYKAGKYPIFNFGDHGRNQIYIVDAQPHKYFAYRWLPGANNFLGDVLTIQNTLVEFRIYEESANKCILTVTESGFKDLPSELMEAAFKQNSGGWDFMLSRLNKYFEND